VVEDRDQAATDTNDVIGKLTARELQIAALVAHGHATKNIAHRLRISEHTVEAYMRRIFLKLKVDNRAAMVYRCAPFLQKVGGGADTVTIRSGPAL
jgi:DNA-binding NarL/FixJ family response regulator